MQRSVKKKKPNSQEMLMLSFVPENGSRHLRENKVIKKEMMENSET